MPRVSVILPVYNASSTVGRAIKAVLAQDMPDFELIVCDDGSADDTFGVCRELLSDEYRAHLVMRGHGGVSTARNAGLRAASGEYVAFVDADDVPAPDWLSSLLELVDGADLAACGYSVLDQNGSVMYDTLQRVPAERVTLSADEFTSDLFSNRLMYQGYVWNKLFRRDLLEADEPVRFKRGIAFNEDRLFVYRYLGRCKTVAVSGTPCYAYCTTEPRTGYASSHATEISAFDEMAMDLIERIKDDEHLTEALYYLGKDTFRAVVELFLAAREEGDPDVLWLSERLADLKNYRKDFGDYPAEWREMMEHALAEVREDVILV